MVTGSNCRVWLITSPGESNQVNCKTIIDSPQSSRFPKAELASLDEYRRLMEFVPSYLTPDHFYST